jgi:hypothetical protein
MTRRQEEDKTKLQQSIQMTPVLQILTDK